MTRDEQITEAERQVLEACVNSCGGGLIGPSTSYFETVPDPAGNTWRFVYLTQLGGKVKHVYYGEGPPPVLTVKADQAGDIRAAADEFIQGFLEITASRKNGEGLVWRIVPTFHSADGFSYFRARYALVPACDIAYQDKDGNTQEVKTFEGGLALLRAEPTSLTAEPFPRRFARIDQIARY